MSQSLVISDILRDQMIAQASQCFPEEACGLIAGLGQEAHFVWPVENELHSPVRFKMAPISQLKAFLQMEKYAVELLGIFHSHPAGPATPSQSDIAEFYYPGTPMILLSPASGLALPENKGRDWQIKGFLIENDRFTEIELKRTI